MFVKKKFIEMFAFNFDPSAWYYLALHLVVTPCVMSPQVALFMQDGHFLYYAKLYWS